MSRVERLVARLKNVYGPLPSPPTDAFVLFVWEILSNHSTPKKRDAAMAALKRAGALTPDGMWKASPQKLADAVALAGPYCDGRLLGLRKGVEIFRRTPDFTTAIKADVRGAMRTLKPLPRMSGESNAYRMLLFVGGHPVLPVDARVSRTATRLGYGERTDNHPKTAKSIRRAIARELPETVDAYRRTYVYLEHHGATTCTESSPHCDECPLLKHCPYGRDR